MPERTYLSPKLKYPWQQAVVDALREAEPELLLDKITAAERAVSARLVQESADPDERLALRGAVIALGCARNGTMDKF
jgi:hypothetical protein